MKTEISGAQKRVIEALSKPGAYMMPPFDNPGKRTGYVTTSGLQGWICPVKLSTFNILLKKSLIIGSHGVYRLNPEP